MTRTRLPASDGHAAGHGGHWHSVAQVGPGSLLLVVLGLPGPVLRPGLDSPGPGDSGSTLRSLSCGLRLTRSATQLEEVPPMPVAPWQFLGDNGRPGH